MLMLFWILQPLPILAPPPTLTFWPMDTFSPISAPGITCEKCQIFVPVPTLAPSST